VGEACGTYFYHENGSEPLLWVGNQPWANIRGRRPLTPVFIAGLFECIKNSLVPEVDPVRSLERLGTRRSENREDYFTCLVTDRIKKKNFLAKRGRLIPVCKERTLVTLMQRDKTAKTDTPTSQFYRKDPQSAGGKRPAAGASSAQPRRGRGGGLI